MIYPRGDLAARRIGGCHSKGEWKHPAVAMSTDRGKKGAILQVSGTVFTKVCIITDLSALPSTDFFHDRYEGQGVQREISHQGVKSPEYRFLDGYLYGR